MVTDTVFKKSSLRNLFLKVVVPGTSEHLPCHTGLLVFCRKFILMIVLDIYSHQLSVATSKNPSVVDTICTIHSATLMSLPQENFYKVGSECELSPWPDSSVG